MLETLGNLGDFLGGIGVVVTLAYLAIQIRHNTGQLRLDSADALQNGMAHAFDPIYQGNHVQSFQKALAGEDLTPAESMLFEFIMFRVFSQYELTFEHHERKAVSRKILEGHDAIAIYMLASPGGKNHWLRVGSKNFGGKFNDHVNSLMQQADSFPEDRKSWQ